MDLRAISTANWPSDTPAAKLRREAAKISENFVEMAPYVVNHQERAVFYEEFDGTWLITDAGPADRFSSTKGSGTATAVATTVADSVNGEVTLKSASDDGAHSANCALLTTLSLGYKASKAPVLEARLKISDVSEAVMFVGFTDVISSTVELPIFLVTTAIDSDAANACGVGYDIDGTTKEFFHGGVKANTDTAPAYSGTAPLDDTYFNVRVEVSPTGGVTGYIDGVAIGDEIPNAVTSTTALCAAIAIGNRSANQVTATIDYIYTEQDR